jgi:hypothetical protein
MEAAASAWERARAICGPQSLPAVTTQRGACHALTAKPHHSASNAQRDAYASYRHARVLIRAPGLRFAVPSFHLLRASGLRPPIICTRCSAAMSSIGAPRTPSGVAYSAPLPHDQAAAPADVCAGGSSGANAAPLLSLLVLAPGSRGDVQPLLAVVRLLIRDGHRRVGAASRGRGGRGARAVTAPVGTVCNAPSDARLAPRAARTAACASSLTRCSAMPLKR